MGDIFNRHGGTMSELGLGLTPHPTHDRSFRVEDNFVAHVFRFIVFLFIYAYQ